MAILFLSLASSLAAADLTLSVGFPVSSTAEATIRNAVASVNSGLPVLVNPGGNLFRFGPVGLGFEIPVLIGGPARAEAGTSGSQSLAYAESIQWAVVPGARLRLAPPLVPFTPWVSVGAGVAGLDRSGASVTATAIPLAASRNANVFARSFAAGLDVKPFPLIVLRAELRTLSYKTPDEPFTGLVSFQGQSRTAVMFLVGAGLRF
jgi:hypothetical protein